MQVLTRNQCPLPRLGFWREQPSQPFSACDEHKDWAFARVRALQPDLVVASNSTTMLDHQAGEPVGAARFLSWRAGMTRTLEQLVPHAGRVVVLSPPPRAGNLQSCVTRRSRPVDCTADVPPTGATCAPPSALRPTAAGAAHVDVEALFCVAGALPRRGRQHAGLHRRAAPDGGVRPTARPAPRAACWQSASSPRARGTLTPWTSTPDLSSPHRHRRRAPRRRSTPTPRCRTTPGPLQEPDLLPPPPLEPSPEVVPAGEPV